MNIPPVQIPENVTSEKLPSIRQFTAWFFLALLAGCSALPGIPETELAAFGPSVERVRLLLVQDRVHEALGEALYLTQTYPSGLTETLVGQAMWRTGQVTEAEARFRRASKTDLAEASVGLATVRASTGRWDTAMRLLSDASGSTEADAQALPLLASAAWRSGDVARTQRHLQAWSRIEANALLARAAAAMAVAVADLEGPPLEWSGDVAVVELGSTIDGGLVIPVRIGDAEGRLLLDLAARQSSISPEFAEAAGLAVRSDGRAAARPLNEPDVTTNRHWPRLEQAACPDLQFGGARLRNAVVGVGQAPAGVDGVLAFDLLLTASWSLRLDGPTMALGPASASDDVHRMIGGSIPATVAWLNARLVHQALAVQVFVYPLVAGERVAVGLDLGESSILDLEQDLGNLALRGRLQMGGWSGEVGWQISPLEVWASAGGVAPRATLGHNLLDDWILHWLPEQAQIRFDHAATDAPSADTRRQGVTLRQR